MAQRERAMASAIVERIALSGGGARRARRFIVRNPTMSVGLAIVLTLALGTSAWWRAITGTQIW